MIECEKYEAKLSHYLDGELTADEAAAVKEHLEVCESCRATLEAFVRADETARDVRDPGESKWQAVWEKVLAESKRGEKRRVIFGRIWSKAAWAAAAAAAVVAFYVLGPGREVTVLPVAAPAFEVVSIEVEAADYSPVIMTGGDGRLPVIWLQHS